MTPKNPSKSIDRNEVRHIAKLAQVEIQEHEEEKLEKDLNAILGYFAQLDAISTDGIEPLSHALDLANAFRSDEVGACLSQEEAMKNAPQSEDGQFRVPPVIE